MWGVRGCWGCLGEEGVCVLTERADGTINHGSGGRPCTGLAPAATFTAFLADMLSGPLSTNLDSPLLQSLHPSVPYSHIHQNDACPSTYRGDRLARLAHVHGQCRARRAPSHPVPHLRLLAFSNGAVITAPRPSVIKLALWWIRWHLNLECFKREVKTGKKSGAHCFSHSAIRLFPNPHPYPTVQQSML